MNQIQVHYPKTQLRNTLIRLSEPYAMLRIREIGVLLCVPVPLYFTFFEQDFDTGLSKVILLFDVREALYKLELATSDFVRITTKVISNVS